MRKGDISPEGFFLDSFNIDKIFEHVIRPIKRRGGKITTGLFDYRTESEIDRGTVLAERNLIVLFDGILMNRDELCGSWDISLFLDVAFETVIDRALARDSGYYGSREEVERRYLNRYIPGQNIYLSSCASKSRADIVIDNDDWRNPRFIKGSL